jgi:hypothetical protein
VPINDFHCGMRGFARDRILGLGLTTTGMEFASEMVVRAAIGGLTITEVPTTLKPDGRSREPHLRTWRDGWRHLRFLLAFSPRWLFLYPAVFLVVLGTAVFARLAVGPVTIGSVTFDIQTMIAAATAIIVGLQAGALAMVSRAYATSLGLLPRSPRVERILDRFTLEWGLIVGFGMALLGVISFVVAVVNWGETDFGRLTTTDMRWPLVGMLAIVAGSQIALVSFLLSLTRIGENETPATAAPTPSATDVPYVRT